MGRGVYRRCARNGAGYLWLCRRRQSISGFVNVFFSPRQAPPPAAQTHAPFGKRAPGLARETVGRGGLHSTTTCVVVGVVLGWWFQGEDVVEAALPSSHLPLLRSVLRSDRRQTVRQFLAKEVRGGSPLPPSSRLEAPSQARRNWPCPLAPLHALSALEKPAAAKRKKKKAKHRGPRGFKHATPNGAAAREPLQKC